MKSDRFSIYFGFEILIFAKRGFFLLPFRSSTKMFLNIESIVKHKCCWLKWILEILLNGKLHLSLQEMRLSHFSLEYVVTGEKVV